MITLDLKVIGCSGDSLQAMEVDFTQADGRHSRLGCLQAPASCPPNTRKFLVRRMVNAGYVGRDRKAVQAHIDELAREGVPPPPSVPMVFPVLSDNITTDGEIEALGDRTSGEAEYVLLCSGGEVLVGIGSDHTDRQVEQQDIVLSKQLCKNVVSREVWPLADVKDGWDDLVMQSFVHGGQLTGDEPQGGDEVLYQRAELRKIIPPDELMELVASRLADGDTEGLVIFSGTIPVLTKEMIFGGSFRAELLDARTGRKLSCSYQVRRLDYMKR